MADFFDPNETTSRFETQTGLIIYWKWFAVGAIAAIYAGSLAPYAASNRLTRAERGRMNFAALVGAVGLGGAAVLNWRRVKWVRTADRGGIAWRAGSETHHREWDQLSNLHTHTYAKMVNGERDAQITSQTLTVEFDDGTSFRASTRELLEYGTFIVYLEKKREQTAARDQSRQNATVREDAEREVADRPATFGPLAIYRHGIEWDGIYTPWEQIEGYEVVQGMLVVRTVSGDEFLRRTVEVGDWRSAVARLDAVADRMAGRRVPAGR